MHILDNIFYRATDSARQCGANIESASLVALQLLAWRKISERQDGNLHATYFQALERNPRACYERACQCIGEALGTSANVPEAWAHPELQRFMFWLQEINLDQLNDGRQLTLALSNELGRKRDNGLPQEIISLLIALAGNLAAKSVYCPFDQYFQFSAEAELIGGAKVSAEIAYTSPLPAAIKVLTNLTFEFAFSNPIYRPHFRESNGSLRQFEFAICNPPWGSQVTMNYLDDTYGRFRGDERFIEHQAIRHLLHQVMGTSVVLVPLSILFGSQMGLRGLRTELVTSGKLRAVINLPSGLLQTTAIASVVLVIDSQGGNSEILLVDADNSRYNVRDGRSRSRLEGWKQLCIDFGMGLQGKEIETGRLVSRDEIEAQDFQLQVNRYLKSDSTRLVEKYFSQHDHRALGELVEVMRPSLLDKEKDEGIKALEVSVADFPAVGYVRSATKQVQILDRKNLADLYLKPNDIVMVVKGAMNILGKVALIGSEAEAGQWVANQVSLVLRADQSKIDPRFLYRYLQSDLAKEQVKNLNLGSVIPNLRPSDLKAILVPLPLAEERHKVIENFRQIVEIQNQLDELTRQRDLLSDLYWPIIVSDNK